jgi:hypothetical protein
MTNTILELLSDREDGNSADISSSPPPTIYLSPKPDSIKPAHPEVIARSVMDLIRSTLAAMFIPPTEWDLVRGQSGVLSIQIESLITSGRPLERCRAFMEPSTVLLVLKNMISKPGTVPNLRGNSEGRFDYAIENIRVISFDLSRAICNVKRAVGKDLTPTASCLSLLPTRADLVVMIKEVNLQVEHEWTIDWNHQRFGSYKGTNVVTVRGLSCQVHVSIFPDDQGPVVTSATVHLGNVEHNCRMGNASVVSGILAQAALDWFAEPLTRLLQSASQSAIERIIRDMNLQFRVNVWNSTILNVFPNSLVEAIVVAIRDHLPSHGVNI